MLMPLPDDLDEKLKELAECQGCVYDDQYTTEERRSMVKLKALGLVGLAWVLTADGRSRLKG